MTLILQLLLYLIIGSLIAGFLAGYDEDMWGSTFDRLMVTMFWPVFVLCTLLAAIVIVLIFPLKNVYTWAKRGGVALARYRHERKYGELRSLYPRSP